MDEPVDERSAQELRPPRAQGFAHHELRDVLPVGEPEDRVDRVVGVDHVELTAEVRDEAVDVDASHAGVALVVALADVEHEEVAARPLGDPRPPPDEVLGELRVRHQTSTRSRVSGVPDPDQRESRVSSTWSATRIRASSLSAVRFSVVKKRWSASSALRGSG